MEIVKVDWNAFNYIHSANTRDAFQKLTEQLFCFEFDQPYGIYRYYNQPYIETMPICFGTEIIGFQSKYFDAASNFSDKETELMNAIIGTHKRYPSVTKVVFYINKEPGISTSPGKDKPRYIENIEACGTSLGIQIVWKGLSQIETMLLRPELEHIRNYFFSTSGGIRTVVAQILNHSQNILDSIDVVIQYKQHSISIPREMVDIEAFLESEKSFLIVHGDGGSGKSAQVKLQLGEEHGYPIWVFRATDFDSSSVPEFIRKFGDCSWDELLSAFDDSPRKVCVIDSAEKVFTNAYQDTFISALRALQQQGWHIIVTIRTNYRASFQNTILKTSDILEHHVQLLTPNAAEELENKYKFSLPADPKLRDFLRNLFYLKLYLSDDRFVSSTTLIEFMDTLWSQVICNSEKHRDSLNVRRGQMMIHLVQENANRGSAYYNPSSEDDWDAITSLNESGIIQYDETMDGYFVCHDVYEEIVLKRIISQTYSRKGKHWHFFMISVIH